MHTPAGKSSTQQRPRHTPGASPSLAHAAAASPSPVAPAVPSLTFSASKHAKSMRAQKAAGTKQAHSRTLFKPALASPFNMPWNPLSLEQSLQAIKLLQHSSAAAPSASPAAASAAAASILSAKAAPAAAASASSSQKRKRPADATPAPVAVAADDSKMTDADAPTSSAASPSGLCLGINAVTRGLETGALSLVIVCRSVNPLALIAHLPVMCHLRQCRLITLHPQINSRMLAQALRHSMPRVQKSAAADAASSSASAAVSASSGRQQKQGAQVCMALGIERTHLESTVAALESFSSLPSLPWLTPVPVVYQPVKVLHTDAPTQRPGKQQQQQQPQQKSKQQSAAGAGAAAGAQTQPGKNATTAAPPASSAATQAGAKSAAASSVASSAAVAPASAAGAQPKQRVESATQRRKKQKVEQQQQRAQTPPGQG